MVSIDYKMLSQLPEEFQLISARHDRYDYPLQYASIGHSLCAISKPINVDLSISMAGAHRSILIQSHKALTFQEYISTLPYLCGIRGLHLGI